MSVLNNNREHAAHIMVNSPVVGQGLMLSSFDYAMGRATYMPGVIAGILKTTAPWLTREQREYVTSTIRERVAEHTAGMECDEATWLDLADAVDKMAGEPGAGRQWAQADVDEAVLFPAFKDRLGIDDWWCMVCSAQRYDYRGDGRLAISDYRKLVGLNLDSLNAKWRTNLMRDVEDAWRDSKFLQNAYSDDGGSADEYYVWLAGLEVDGAKARMEYLDHEYCVKAFENVSGNDGEGEHGGVEEE